MPGRQSSFSCRKHHSRSFVFIRGQMFLPPAQTAPHTVHQKSCTKCTKVHNRPSAPEPQSPQIKPIYPKLASSENTWQVYAV